MKYLSLLLLCFISFNLEAQTDNINLNNQLKAMSSAFLEDDYSIVADYTYPKILEMMGGKEAMIETTKESISKMKSQGFSFLDISFKDPSTFFEQNGDTQCAITQVLVMETPNGKVQSESTIIAISEDEGENWVFLDSSGMPKASLQNFYTNLHPDIEVKASQKKNLE